MQVEEKHRKILCLGLFIIAMVVILTTGCEKKDFTKGTIELTKYQETDESGKINYEETEEVTNYVKIVTNKDKVMILELYPEVAPITVANFQKLVSEKFYDEIIFHRIIENFMIQGGGFKQNGNVVSSDPIKGEFSSNNVTNNLKHDKGIVSMARQNGNNDSASSQFFICNSGKENVSHLDGDYAAFGRVIAGYDVVESISKVKTDSNDKPTSTQKMETVRFVKVEKTNE